MKYNRSEIFTKAWKMVREYAMTISDALRQAWKEAKAMVGRHTVALKEWFSQKLDRECKRYNIFLDVEYIGEKMPIANHNHYVNCQILKETEKAFQIHFESGAIVGSAKGWTTWVPKSVIMNIY